MKLLSLLQFLFRARTIYDLHSPFAYSFAREVLEDRRWYYVFSEAETLRGQWMLDRRTIAVTDYGAGSQTLAGGERKIADLAKRVATPPLFCRWLFKTALLTKPGSILELGASLGISAAYLSAAAPGAKMITVEGCPETAELARQTLRQSGSRAEVWTGRFDELLPGALAQLERLDLLHLDGDHSRGGTLRYLEQCLEKSHPGTVWVIGDIHWSAEMEKAWREVQAFPGVRMTIDLYGMGVVFFRQEILNPVHLTLVPSLWKPWRRGRWGGL